MQFLARISLIDDIEVRAAGTQVTVTANVIKVGKLRQDYYSSSSIRSSSGGSGGGGGGGRDDGGGGRGGGTRQGKAMRSAAAAAVYGSATRNEDLKIRWVQNNLQRDDLDDVLSFTGDEALLAGVWKLIVVFDTDEIRNDPNSLTISEKAFTV